MLTFYGDKYLDHATWTTGYWGGEYIEIKLSNQTTIKCLINKKVGEDVWSPESAQKQMDISDDCHTQ